jgi:hypothetical protein
MERFKRNDAPSAEGPSLSSHSRLRTASPADSARYTPRYANVREVLLRYLSGVLVDSVLERALTARKLDPATLSNDQLAEVAADVMVGLRMFVPEARLPLLMLDLAEVLEAR